MRAKLFLDDLRQPPDDTFVVARTVSQFVVALYQHLDEGFSEIHFDHDLGYDDPHQDGHWAMEQLIEWCEYEDFPKPDRIVIHTMNPVESNAMMQRATRYFTEAQIDRMPGSYTAEVN